MFDPVKFFFFTLSWTSAFSIGYFNIPLFLGCLITIKEVLTVRQLKFRKVEIGMLISAIAIFSWTIATTIWNGSVGNFAAAYILVYTILFFGPMYTIARTKDSWEYWEWFKRGLEFIAILIVMESIIRWLTGFDITSIVPQAKENLAIAGVEYGLNRARGFSTEPVIAGIYMALGLVIETYSLKIKLKKIAKIVLYAMSIVCTGSASAMVAGTCGVIVICISRIKRMKRIPRITVRRLIVVSISAITSSVVVALAVNYLQPYIEVFGTVFEKLSGQGTAVSVVARLSGINEFLEYWQEDIWGLGGYVGRYSNEGSAINYYVTLLGDVGLVGFIVYLSPIIITWYNLARRYKYDKLSGMKLAMLVTATVSLCFHGTFYASPIWAICIFVLYL